MVPCRFGVRTAQDERLARYHLNAVKFTINVKRNRSTSAFNQIVASTSRWLRTLRGEVPGTVLTIEVVPRCGGWSGKCSRRPLAYYVLRQMICFGRHPTPHTYYSYHFAGDVIITIRIYSYCFKPSLMRCFFSKNRFI